MHNKFFNRINELDALTQEMAQSGFIVLMGRRRVGKTRLIREWASRSQIAVAYSQAIEATIPQQLNQLWNDIKGIVPVDIEPKTWDDFLKIFKTIKVPALIILDEFPYLVATDASLPSRLQKWLDHDRPDGLTLCVLGSSQTMMHEIFLESRRPLYMRARRVINLRPLAYRYFAESLQCDPLDPQTFEKFSLVGGIPKYWQLMDGQKSTLENAESLFFGELSFFDNETLRLVTDESISRTNILAILEAIGRGIHKPSEIASRLGIKQTSLSKSLSILTTAHFIVKEQPFGDSERNSKKSLYKIIDPFLLFFYGVYSPHRSRWSTYSNAIKEKLIHDHAAQVFEIQYREGFPSASRYFEGKDIEIDCVHYASENRLIVSEVKFRKLSTQDKERLTGSISEKFKRSHIHKLSETLKVEFEIVDVTRGLREIADRLD